MRRAGADETANQRMRTAGGNAEQPGQDVPDDRAAERREDDARGHHVRRDNALADGLGDVEPEDQEGDEVEERGPEDRE